MELIMYLKYYLIMICASIVIAHFKYGEILREQTEEGKEDKHFLGINKEDIQYDSNIMYFSFVFVSALFAPIVLIGSLHSILKKIVTKY